MLLSIPGKRYEVTDACFVTPANPAPAGEGSRHRSSGSAEGGGRPEGPSSGPDGAAAGDDGGRREGGAPLQPSPPRVRRASIGRGSRPELQIRASSSAADSGRGSEWQVRLKLRGAASIASTLSRVYPKP